MVAPMFALKPVASRHAFGLLLVAGVAASTPALAHADNAPTLGWNNGGWISVALVLAVFGYVRGVLAVAAEARGRVYGFWRCASFAAGIGALVVALLSPLDALDDQLFSAHMVQHMILMLVAPLLLVWARPATAWLWAFPLPARRSIGRCWTRTPGLAAGVRWLLGPVAVGVACSFALWFWHLPGPYRWALRSEAVHTTEHLCFFVTSLAFWSLVLAPYGRRQLSYGASLIFVGALGLQMGLLGAVLTFASRPVYMQPATTLRWGLSALEDQQLAGVIMWVPAGLLYLVVMAVLFAAWLRDAERKADRIAASGNATPYVRKRVVLALVCAGMALGGCQDKSAPKWRITGADPARGPALIKTYGCDACHTVPGVRQARGTVGPPLSQFARRTYIAGTLHNQPDNLIRWIRDPQHVLPGVAMPDTGVTARDARDIAAYLYTLN